MIRQKVINVWDKAHPDPICRGWKKLIRDGYVSYTWRISDALQERDYQVFMGVWQHIDYCPFCAKPINRGNPLHIQTEEEKSRADSLKRYLD
jgi:hypothetical protein